MKKKTWIILSVISLLIILTILYTAKFDNGFITRNFSFNKNDRLANSLPMQTLAYESVSENTVAILYKNGKVYDKSCGKRIKYADSFSNLESAAMECYGMRRSGHIEKVPNKKDYYYETFKFNKKHNIVGSKRGYVTIKFQPIKLPGGIYQIHWFVVTNHGNIYQSTFARELAIAGINLPY